MGVNYLLFLEYTTVMSISKEQLDQLDVADLLLARKAHIAERAEEGIAPMPLAEGVDADFVGAICALLTDTLNPIRELKRAQMLTLFSLSECLQALENEVFPGATEAAKVKAEFLTDVAEGRVRSSLVSRERAAALLGNMLGGNYSVKALIKLLQDANPTVAETAADALGKTTLVYEEWRTIQSLKATNPYAQKVWDAWKNAEWFESREPVSSVITVIAYVLAAIFGNTEELSPAPDAHTRPDIVKHALRWLVTRVPDAIQKVTALKLSGHPVVLVAYGQIGGGSSRWSGWNNTARWIGFASKVIPNFFQGGYILAQKIGPIFYEAALGAGAIPIVLGDQVTNIKPDMKLQILPYEGLVKNAETGEVLATFTLDAEVLEYARGGGMLNYFVGRLLTNKVRQEEGLGDYTGFMEMPVVQKSGVGYTLAQKILGRAAGYEGVHPGSFILTKITTVASQDTTGPMTRDAIRIFACVQFVCEFVLQSFCHTAALPKPIDVENHTTLAAFMKARGGVSLRWGLGVIHTWINRCSMPDEVGVGGDSHTRFILGMSIPADSLLTGFASVFGIFPMKMPESVLFRFKGDYSRFSARDLQQMMVEKAIEAGLMSADGKLNKLAGLIWEILGLERLAPEKAFEILNSMGERDSKTQVFHFAVETVAEFLRSNVAFLKKQVVDGLGDQATLVKRIQRMEEWLANPQLFSPDDNAEYKYVIEIDLDAIDNEPLVTRPCKGSYNDVVRLSIVSGIPVEEAIILSCTANLDHYVRSINKICRYIDGGKKPKGRRLWYAPASADIEQYLRDKGYYDQLKAAAKKVGLVVWDYLTDKPEDRFRANIRLEKSGCGLCMGNQEKILRELINLIAGSENLDVSAMTEYNVTGSNTRNNDGRFGTLNWVMAYMSSPDVSTDAWLLGMFPTLEEHRELEALSETEEVLQRFDRDPEYNNVQVKEAYQQIAERLAA